MDQIEALVLDQSVEQSVQRSDGTLDAETVDAQERAEGQSGLAREAVTADDEDEEVLAAGDAGGSEAREKRFHGLEGAGAREALDDGEIGVVVVGEARVVFASMIEDLEGEVEVLLAGDHGDQALRVEALRPGPDGWSHRVGVEIEGGGQRMDGQDGTGDGGATAAGLAVAGARASPHFNRAGVASEQAWLQID